jgi:L-2-hydroxyglutarate oxidase LhgO
MTTYDYDYIVVGAGIAGLMTSIRLAENGKRVILFEQRKVGSGASIGNQGIIHSGALYAELHPEVVKVCQEATTLFLKHFADSVIPTRRSLYFGDPHRVELVKAAWLKQGLKFEDSEPTAISEFIRPKIANRLSGTFIYEPIISPKQILINLVQLCLSLGVEIYKEVSVNEVLSSSSRFIGVKIGCNQLIRAKGCILCAGVENRMLLERMKLKSSNRIKSRLATVIAFKNNALDRPLICLNYGAPTLVPTVCNTVLGSLYGGDQPSVTRKDSWSVSSKHFNEVGSQVKKFVRRSAINFDESYVYSHPKTEASSGYADFAGVEPLYSVLDHAVLDGINNLWSLIPGKMTFAFHATSSLVSQILSLHQSIDIGSKIPTITELAKGLVQSEQWQPPG